MVHALADGLAEDASIVVFGGQEEVTPITQRRRGKTPLNETEPLYKPIVPGVLILLAVRIDAWSRGWRR